MQEKSIKVLHLMSNLSLKSGVASVVVNYCRYINKDKINFSFVYFDEVNTETYIKELKELGAEIYFIPRARFSSDWSLFCKQHWGEYDILHNHQTFLAPLLVNVKKKLGVDKVVTHAHVTKFSDTRLKSIRNGFLSFPCRFISDKLVACSTDAGIALFGNAFKKNGVVIRNAICTDLFRFDEFIRNDVRASLKLEDSFVIGHIGNMTPQKNHVFIIEVFRSVLDVRPDAKLLLLGDGYLRDKIVRKIEEYNLYDKVILLGVRNEVFRYLNAMDVFLFPSLFEGLGIVLVEAQACGLKCIYSDEVPMEADCNVQENIRMSLKMSAKDWAQNVCSITSRVDNTEAVINAGYDIFSATNLLENFYQSLMNGGGIGNGI